MTLLNTSQIHQSCPER